MRTKSPYLILITILLLTACKNVKDLDDQELKDVSQVIDEQEDKMAPEKGKSSAEKEWQKVFKECNSSYTFPKAFYLGLSIQNGIGTVISKKTKEILHFEPNFNQQDSNLIIN